MIIFTCNEFELDLSNYNISSVYTNSWFNDGLFSVLTYPIDLNIEDYFEVYRHTNISNLKREFEGKLNYNGKLQSAKLMIMSVTENRIRVQIESGLEQFPSWDLKLSELNLEKREVSDIIHHAEFVIRNNYPDYNYNFPMVHVDFYREDGLFKYFEKIYNNRTPEGFVRNYFDETTEEVHNLNIVRPMPYFLHVLQTGIEQANYTLHGDVLEIDKIKKSILIPSGPIDFDSDRPETVEVIVPNDDGEFYHYYNTPDGPLWLYKWDVEQEILHHGKFNFKGKIIGRIERDFGQYFRAYVDEELVYENRNIFGFFIDFDFTTAVGGSILRLEFVYPQYGWGDNRGEFLLKPLELYDDNGDLVQYLLESNTIDLSRNVPDVTFGDFVNFLRAQFNLSFDLINENEIHMNVLNEVELPTTAIDLQSYEVDNYTQDYQDKTAYELMYTEPDLIDLPVKNVLYELEALTPTNYSTTEDTVQIEIKGIPLQPAEIGGIKTAHLAENKASVICFALYDGLQDDNNYTQDMSAFNLDMIVNDYYSNWLNLQLKGVVYSFSFKKYADELYDFSEKQKVWCYNNYHYITEMTITRISPDIDEVELKTLSLRP